MNQNEYLLYDKLGYKGRLGNALFQVAGTIGLARSYGLEPRFNGNWMHRPFFSLPDEWFQPVNNAQDPTTMVPHLDIRARPFLQDIGLFAEHMNEVRRVLSPSPIAREVVESVEQFHALKDPILSVHVRRGDKVPGQDPGIADNFNYYVPPTLDYYQRAIAALKDDVESIAVFSDDPIWAEENIDCDYVHYGVPYPKEEESNQQQVPHDYVDLFLQADCAKHVVTGSTFGIWGALLAKDMNAIRCTPVFGEKLSFLDENLLFWPTWQVMSL